jgi:hypothetical protein
MGALLPNLGLLGIFELQVDLAEARPAVAAALLASASHVLQGLQARIAQVALALFGEVGRVPRTNLQVARLEHRTTDRDVTNRDFRSVNL